MIKALELRKALDEKRKALTSLEERIGSFATRSAELETKIAEATDENRDEVEAEVEKFNAEKTEAETEAQSLRDAVDAMEKELEELESAEPSAEKNPQERNIEKMTNLEVRSTQKYIDAFAKYIKSGKDEEVRSLLTENVSGGTVPVPTIVDGFVKTAWDREQIMSRVRKTYLKGNVKVGFEISSTGAVVHTEGTAAPDEETLTLGIVTMTPSNIKKWITISDEALDLNGEAFLQYIYDELTYQIAKKAADILVGLIANSPAVSTATAPAQAVVKAGIAQDTIVTAIGNLSDEAANPVIIMNKATYAAFKAAQYNGNFDADIFEGLEVLFNNSLPVYSAASEDDVYAIVGDLGYGAQANLPNGDTISFVYDGLSLAESDLVKIVGREYIGLGVVAVNAFCNITKPATT